MGIGKPYQKNIATQEVEFDSMFRIRLPMCTTLLRFGVACVIAAIIGGGLTAGGWKIPVFKSLSRQVTLAVFGLLLIGSCVAIKWWQQHKAEQQAQEQAAAQALARRQIAEQTAAQQRDQQLANQRRIDQEKLDREKYTLELFCADDELKCAVNGVPVGSTNAHDDCNVPKPSDLTLQLHKGKNTLQCTEYDEAPPLWSYKFHVLRGTSIILNENRYGSSSSVKQPDPFPITIE